MGIKLNTQSRPSKRYRIANSCLYDRFDTTEDGDYLNEIEVDDDSTDVEVNFKNPKHNSDMNESLLAKCYEFYDDDIHKEETR